MKAQLVIKDRIRKSNVLIERVVWAIPTPVKGCTHYFKYRLYCGQNGETVVRYDNESGKGDHRHLGKDERQQPYMFITLEQLIIDFEADVIRLSGGKNESDY
ncbi:MAG: hypothetical protein HY935_07580 [Nitrosomonadales bacterium]|nr:hypothetical protein [Nitrosomonadales bacterium]